MNRKLLIAPGLAAIVVIALTHASHPQAAASASASSAAQGKTQDQIIEHVQPRRDSVGGLPERYEWTAVKGAEHYSIGVWTDFDQMIFRQDNIPSNSFEWPRDGKLDMGTYFWSVTAWSNGRAIAGSGLAAFVINR